MYQVSLRADDLEGASIEQLAEKFWRFSREEMAKGSLDALGEQTFTDGKVPKALSHLVVDPPNVLIKLVRSAAGDKSLKPQTIRESLARVLSPLLGPRSASSSQPTNSAQSRRSAGARQAWHTRKSSGVSKYSEDLHTSGKPSEVLDLYHQIDEYCLGMPPVQVQKQVLAKCIAYRRGKHTFCSVHIGRSGLRVWLRLRYGDLTNPPPFARDVSSVGHWGVGHLELSITNANQMGTAKELILRSLDAS